MAVLQPNKNAARETALKLFKGEVIEAFDANNIGLDLVTVREITGGKSEQFIVTGSADEADVQTHNPGDTVNEFAIPNDEVTITVTQKYTHATFLDTLDETLAQYDARTVLSRQSGEVLAKKIDKDIFKLIGNDAAAATPKPGQKAAKTVVATGYAAATTAEDKGNKLVEAIFEARARLDEDDVSLEPVTAVKPREFYNIVQSTRGVNTDYTAGNGGLDSGKIKEIAGVKFAVSNHLDTTTNTKLLALVFTRDVAGVLKAINLKSEANYDPDRLGYKLTSYYAMGMGVLNPTGLAVVNSD